MAEKKRVLFLITIQFSVRYLLRTGILERVSQFARPIVILNWRDENLIRELQELGAETHLFPDGRTGKWYHLVRRIVEVWHVGRVKSPSAKIDSYRFRIVSGKRRQSVKILIANLFGKVLRYLPGSGMLLEMAYKKSLEWDTNYNDVCDAVKTWRPDAVVSLTPFLSEEHLILFACQQLRIKTIASILSFDNLTTRNFIPILFDHYLVWNEYNYNELLRIYGKAKSKTVDKVGPPQFDFYWKSEYLWPEGEWRERLGLPPVRPVILFGAGYYTVAPHEPIWLAQLDQAIENGEIMGKPVILFRRHPVDPIDRWRVVLDAARNIVRDDPWNADESTLSKTDISMASIEKLCSTLKWSAVHVNASSTMTIDGAIFDRPQIGPAYDHSSVAYNRLVRELYDREHYLPITKSGGLHVVYSREELIAAVNEAFANPARRHDQRQFMIKEICCFTDGKSSDRVVGHLSRFLQVAHSDKALVN